MIPKTALFLLLLSALTAAADDTTAWSDTLPTPLRSAAIYAVFTSPQSKAPAAQVMWNCADSANHMRLDIGLSKITHDNKRILEWTLSRLSRGKDSVFVRGNTEIHANRGTNAVLTLALTADESGATALLSSGSDNITIPVPFRTDTLGTIVCKTKRNTVALSHSALYSAAPQTENHTPANITATTTMWQYLDRDIDPEKADIKIFYNLMIEKLDPDTYIIYAVDGNRKHHKGYLRSTPFANHYNLEWHDARRRIHSTDCSADVLLGGTVLRLNFPLLGSSVRFSRQP